MKLAHSHRVALAMVRLTTDQDGVRFHSATEIALKAHESHLSDVLVCRNDDAERTNISHILQQLFVHKHQILACDC